MTRFWYTLKNLDLKTYDEINTNKIFSFKSTHIQVQNFNPIMKVWEKHQNNKIGYGIEAFPKNKILLFHTPTKLNALQ